MIAIYLIALHWAMLALPLATAEVVTSRSAYGVYFHQVETLAIRTDQWVHSFDIELPKVQKSRATELEPDCSNKAKSKNCSDFSYIIAAVSNLHQRAESKINELVKRIHDTLQAPGKKEKKRKHKRGFINFIGDIAHSLFGVARDSDITAAQDRIKIILEKQNRVLGQFESDMINLASATSITNKRIDAINSHVNTQDKIITDLSRAIKFDFQTSLELTLLMSETLYNFTCLEAHLQSLLISVEALAAGRLEPTLLHKPDIQKVLRILARKLKNTKTQARILITDATYFYRANTHLTIKKHNILCISLKIPITTLPFYLDLYKVTVTPKAIASDNQHSTLITNLPRYFAISNDNQFHATWETLPLLATGQSYRIIDKVDIQLRTNKQECIRALFDNNPRDVDKFCETFLLNQKPASFQYLSSNTIAIENSRSNFTLACPIQKVSTIESCTSCLLTIPNECTLSTFDNFFPASLPQSHVYNATHTVAHTFNLAVLQKFFSPSDLEKLKADTTLAQQITLQIPTFINAQSNASDKQLVTDLSQAIEKVKEGEILFKTNQDFIQEHLDNLNDISVTSFTALNHYTLPIGAIFVSLLTALNIYLLFKINRLSAIVIALQQNTIAQAKSIQPVWIFSTEKPSLTTPGSVIPEYLFNETYFKLTVITLLMSIIIVWLTSKICKLYSRLHKINHTHLAINITNAQTAISIPWFKLHHAIADYEITALSEIANVRIHKFCVTPTLNFKWQITVLHKPSRMSVSLPQTIRVSHCMAKNIARIIGPHKRYFITLNLASSEFNLPLSLDTSPTIVSAQ
jgi:hypothetical protein